MFSYLSIAQARSRPIAQALYCLVFCIFALGALKIGSSMGWQVLPAYYWGVCVTCVLVYIILSGTFGTRVADIRRYWLHSVYSFVGLLVVSNLLAAQFSGVAMRQSGGFAWLYCVLIIFYLSFLSITTMIKQLWTFFEEENDRKLKKDGMR